MSRAFYSYINCFYPWSTVLRLSLKFPFLWNWKGTHDCFIVVFVVILGCFFFLLEFFIYVWNFCVCLGIIESKEGKISRSNVFHVSHRSTEKAALLSPEDDVQKSDVSSSSQGLVEKEALGPMLLEVRSIPHVDLFNHHLSNLSSSSLLNTNPPPPI